jgi:hypothetical protein
MAFRDFLSRYDAGSFRADDWDICRDCIEPLANELGTIVFETQADTRFANSDRIRLLYGALNADFAVMWFKLHESVAFAGDFEAMLKAPLDMLEELEASLKKEQKSTVPGQKSGWLCSSLDKEQSSLSHKMDTAFLEAIAYLRQLAILLRAKLDDRRVNQSDLLTEPLTKSKIASYFEIDQGTFESAVLNKYHHVPIGEGQGVRYRLRIADMPPQYQIEIGRLSQQ